MADHSFHEDQSSPLPDQPGGQLNPERKPLSQDEVESIIGQEIAESMGYVGSEISEQRRQALQYYYGRPFGNEQEGRSTVILQDVLETIEWILPSLMRIFFGHHKVVRYTETREEFAPQAEQANRYAHHVLMKEADGFLEMHNWFKTALLEKNSYLAHYVEDVYENTREEHRDLTIMELTDLLEDDQVTLVDGEEIVKKVQREALNPETQQVEMVEAEEPLYNVVIRRIGNVTKMVIEGVAPEEMLIARRAQYLNLNKVPFCARRFRTTLGGLLAMGIPEELLQDLPADVSPEYDQGRTERRDDEENFPSSMAERSDWASRELWVTECFLYVDQDGDGYAEKRRILVAGDDSSTTILENEEITETPISCITPIPMPYKHYGLSVADLVMDLQLIRSTILRQILDNLYLTNNSRYAVVEGMVEMDDLLTVRPGGIVRVEAPGMIEPLETSPMGPLPFNTLQYLQDVRENRTGVTRYTQGNDSDSLNQTARGITEIMNAAQMRIDLIARIFAETGVKNLFRSLYKSMKALIPKDKRLKVSGIWAECDPSSWPDEIDVDVEVGLGTGQSLQRQEFLLSTLNIQSQLQQIDQRLVTPQNLYNAASRLAEEAGFMAEGELFTKPIGDPPEPDPIPEMEKIAADQEKSALDRELRKAEALTEGTARAGELELRETEISNRHEADMARIALDRDKLALEERSVMLDEDRLELERENARREGADDEETET